MSSTTKNNVARNKNTITQRNLSPSDKFSFASNNKQEVLTPVTSQTSVIPAAVPKTSNKLRSTNNSLKRNTTPAAEKVSADNDVTGFAPRAPPPGAKSFDPFSRNQNNIKQQTSKFQFKPKTNEVDTTGFAPKAPPPNANQFNPVPKKSQLRFVKSASTSNAVIDTTGFVPVAPPPTAKKFNPVPNRGKTIAFDFGADKERTTAISDFVSTTPMSYDSFTINPDSDFKLNLDSVGKALLNSQPLGVTSADTADYDLSEYSDDYTNDLNVGVPLPDAQNLQNHAQNQQINVLGALSSTGNVLNSPKYNLNTDHKDSNHEADKNVTPADNRATTFARSETTQASSTRGHVRFTTPKSMLELDNIQETQTEAIRLANQNEIGSNINAFELNRNTGSIKELSTNSVTGRPLIPDQPLVDGLGSSINAGGTVAVRTVDFAQSMVDLPQQSLDYSQDLPEERAGRQLAPRPVSTTLLALRPATRPAAREYHTNAFAGNSPWGP